MIDQGQDSAPGADVRRRAARPGPGWRIQPPPARRLLATLDAAWLVFLLAEKAVTGRVWFGEAVGMVPPFLFALVPLVLLAGTAVARGRRLVTAGMALAALGLGLDQAGLNFDAISATGRVPAGAVHVVSWNSNCWDQLLGTQGHFYRFLTSQHADIYLLQEYQHVGANLMTPVRIDDLAELRREFPGYQIAVKGELVTLSRYPIVAEPAIGPEKSLPADADWRAQYDTDKVLRTDLLIDGKVVSVYNVHLPVWNEMPDGLVSASFYAAMRDSYAQRTAWLSALSSDVADNRAPVVVAGDFDTSAAMADLDALRSELSDAQGASTSFYPEGWQQGGVMPFWRTDWAFTGHGVATDRYTFVTPQLLSDHSLQDLWVSPPTA
jgi:endonuclease/exonuclease/phosphatase (EEP) superfamily protein YafD